MDRVLAWFSCGAASAYAAKLAVDQYGERCEVCYCDTFAELDAAINKKYVNGERIRVFLDELPPTAGRYKAEPDIECGVLCVA